MPWTQPRDFTSTPARYLSRQDNMTARTAAA